MLIMFSGGALHEDENLMEILVSMNTWLKDKKICAFDLSCVTINEV